MNQTENPMLNEFSVWLQNNQAKEICAPKAIIPFLHHKLADLISLVLLQQQYIHYTYNLYDGEMANVTLELQKEMTNFMKLLREIESIMR